MTSWYLLLTLGLQWSLCFSDSHTYLGSEVGPFPDNAAHGVKGTVYAISTTQIMIKGFSYDGQGPDAFFWAGKQGVASAAPDDKGIIIPNEMGSTGVLGAYDNADIVLTLPDGLTTGDILWVSVWCRQFKANFGSVLFLNSLCVPDIVQLNPITSGAHGVMTGNVYILDSRTIKIEGFSYDGQGPDAFFLIGSGTINAANGVKVPDENGNLVKLGIYSNQTITLTLPEGVDLLTSEWLSVYCLQATSNFGNLDLTIPVGMCVIPSMQMPMYFGTSMGPLTTLGHEVRGDLYVVDNNRLMLRHFYYDGQGPDAFFYIGLAGQHGDTPNENGIIVMNEMGTSDKLGEYMNANLVLTLPSNVLATEISWFSVWCKQAKVDFGDFIFPTTFTVPGKVDLGPLVELAHGAKADKVWALDKRTLRLVNFFYDGQGPDAYFWVGMGTPDTNGHAIPDEKGSMVKLGVYDGQTIELRLPGGMTVDTIDYLSVWCKNVAVDFGNVMFPAGDLSVPPFIPPPAMPPLANCETMAADIFNVAWEIDGTDIIFDFSGNIGLDNGYMAFGISGSTSSSAMGGADPMVVYLEDDVPRLADYTISAYSLCSGGSGVCPDADSAGTDNLNLMSAYITNGVTRARFRRPLVTGDPKDKDIMTDQEMYVVWAMGNVNSFNMVTKHTNRIIGNMKLNFGRDASATCTPVVGDVIEDPPPWPAQMISGQTVKEFTARIGPSAGLKGYAGLTGQVSWGIAWYLNGLLIPEVTLKRGETYTFYSAGGTDSTNDAQYHPFYITDDPVGGYFGKSEAERQAVTLYAGTTQNATGVYGTEGEFCDYTSSAKPEDYATFGEYAATLNLNCADGQKGMFTWKPDVNTPDLVYYQCFTHNYLGWKIHVVDDYESPDCGVNVGALSENAHDVTGTVYVIDEQTIVIKNFNYDGQGPDAYFWAGKKGVSSAEPDSKGMIIPNEMGSTNVLEMYMNADITLTLPTGTKVSDLQWLSVWCRNFSANFGDIRFASNLSPPASVNIGPFTTQAHGVSSGDVYVMDTKTIWIQNFNYDGLGPDAFFYVGSGPITGTGGMKIPNEMGRLDVLKSYNNKDITLKLPDSLTISDITWLSVWCFTAATGFGNVQFESSVVNNVPDYKCLQEMKNYDYLGEMLGPLQENAHGVSGDVYIVDSSRIRITHFNYDGTGPDAFFYIGKKGEHGDTPSGSGIIIPNEFGATDKLTMYTDADIVLTLPSDTMVTDLAWFSVWCRQAKVDFGSIQFPSTIDNIPAPASLGQFQNTNHGVSGMVEITDKRTILITNFNYDGTGPDAFFIVGKGNPGPTGTKLRDGRGRREKLGRYDAASVELMLPMGMTVDDVDYLSVYCVSVKVNFGNVRLDEVVYNVPPFIPMNCETMMDKTFNVAWQIQGNNIEFKFSGVIGATNGYMAFGISGSTSSSAMIGSDPMVVYLDNGLPMLADYTINAYSLCAGGTGVCPDTTMTNGADNLQEVSADVRDGVTTVTFKRPLAASDANLDKAIPIDGDVYIVWALGQVNDGNQVTKHKDRIIGNKKINFGRSPSFQCRPLEMTERVKLPPWKIPPISGEMTKQFDAVIGLTGGQQGYEGIVGKISWGIAWYINGVLIPQLVLKRGETYTFRAFGGNDPSNQAKFHPFYITDDPVGGYATKTAGEKQAVKLFAGTKMNATGVYGTEGCFCEYTSPDNPDNFPNFAMYGKTLTKDCDCEDPGMFTWTPDAETPDLVYYQCFTHNYLGWKIRIVDEFMKTEPPKIKVSNLEQAEAETALFLLVAVCFVLFLAVIMLGVNYSGMKTQYKKLEEKYKGLA